MYANAPSPGTIQVKFLNDASWLKLIPIMPEPWNIDALKALWAAMEARRHKVNMSCGSNDTWRIKYEQFEQKQTQTTLQSCPLTFFSVSSA